MGTSRQVLLGGQRLLAGTLLILLASVAEVSGKDYLQLGRQEELPALGIKFRGLKDTNAQPLPSLNTFKLKRSDGVEVEAYDLLELWYHEQCMGRWGNAAGTMILARMMLPHPESAPVIYRLNERPMVLREGFDDWRKQGAEEWNVERRHRWLELFVGAKLLPDPETMKRDGPARAVTQIFRQPEGASPVRWIYLVSPAGDPASCLVLIYEAAPGADIKKSERAVLQSLASLTFYRPTREEAIVDKEMGTRREIKRDEWSPEYIASREQVIKNIEHLKDWWYLPTDNFILVANLENRKTIRIIEENLEACRNVFTEFYPVKHPLTAVSVCRVFRERSEYVTYVGQEHQWSAGMWVSNRKELVVSPTDWGSVQKQREMLVNVVFHESFHQYIFYVTGEIHTAIWFNEGNATFFEGIEFKSKGKYEMLPTFRSTQVISMAERGLPPVEKLLQMTHQEFVGDNRTQNYALVWALVYFLRKGCQTIKKEAEYGDILSRYYDAVIETRNPDQATEIAWKGVDMTQFNADFSAFWSKQKEVNRSRRVEPLKYRPLSD